MIFGERSIHSNRQIRDFIFYLSGSLILALIAIIRLPVFTSHFTPAEFGLFSLVSITYTYLSVALYNWINSCVYRYYHEYEGSGQLHILYSNIFLIFLTASIVIAASVRNLVFFCRREMRSDHWWSRLFVSSLQTRSLVFCW